MATRLSAKGRGPSLQFGLAAFLATLFLGAGVFSIPLEIPVIGFAPLVVGIALIFIVSRRLYMRQAATLLGGDLESAQDVSIGSAVDAAGAGPAGRALPAVGLAIYVLGAITAYAVLGSTALDIIGWLGYSHGSLLALAGAGSLVLTGRLDSHHALLGRLLRLCAVWSIGVGVADWLFVLPPLWSLLLIFVVGVLVTGRSGGISSADSRSGLLPEHARPVASMVLQFAFMAALAVLVAIERPLRLPELLPSGGLSWTGVSSAIGVVLFAFVGTGINCLGGYREMASPEFRAMTVRRAMGLVVTVQLVWLTIVGFSESPQVLALLNDVGSNSALGMMGPQPTAGGVLEHVGTAIACVATLVAVTNAASGFSSSLAAEIGALAVRLRPAGLVARNAPRVKLSVIAVAVSIACSQVYAGDVGGRGGINDLLSIAGIAGGGILVFVAPLLAGGSAATKRGTALGGFAAAVVLGCWGTAIMGSSGGVWAVVAGFLAWAPTAATALPAWRIARVAGWRRRRP